VPVVAHRRARAATGELYRGVVEFNFFDIRNTPELIQSLYVATRKGG